MRSIPLQGWEIRLIVELRLLRKEEQDAIQDAVHHLLESQAILRAGAPPDNVVSITTVK